MASIPTRYGQEEYIYERFIPCFLNADTNLLLTWCDENANPEDPSKWSVTGSTLDAAMWDAIAKVIARIGHIHTRLATIKVIDSA